MYENCSTSNFFVSHLLFFLICSFSLCLSTSSSLFFLSFSVSLTLSVVLTLHWNGKEENQILFSHAIVDYFSHRVVVVHCIWPHKHHQWWRNSALISRAFYRFFLKYILCLDCFLPQALIVSLAANKISARIRLISLGPAFFCNSVWIFFSRPSPMACKHYARVH